MALYRRDRRAHREESRMFFSVPQCLRGELWIPRRTRRARRC